MTLDLYAAVSILAVIFAQFMIESRKRVLLQRLFYFFRTLPSFRILVIWWVRWILQRRIWKTWIWIRVSRYVRYRIEWVVAWRRISFRCHYLYWWVIQCWWRFNCCPISKKCLWSGYCIMCMYQMYRQRVSISSCRGCMSCCVLWFSNPWQHLFYCMNIGWIIDLSDVCQIVWNELIWSGMIRNDVNRVGILVITNYRISAPSPLNFKIIFALIIFENVVSSKIFTFIFFCAMPRRALVGEIRCPSVKEAKAPDVSW